MTDGIPHVTALAGNAPVNVDFRLANRSREVAH
jgi:hypothetical protein